VVLDATPTQRSGIAYAQPAIAKKQNESARVRAYGAVLNPKRAGRHRGTEGSRTKAAIGASKYGLALKISSDGGITVFHAGKEFISI
jgi:hypothetical protein